MVKWSIAYKRLMSLKKAYKNAKNPEFKELWKQKEKELIEKLHNGNSYDELSDEVLH
jgi:uncharacterized coiled-coil DUF342 family protein